MEKVVRAPRRSNYVIGIAVLMVGLALFAILLHTPRNAVPPEIQIIVPGAKEFYLPEAGKYTIFYEYLSIIGDKTYSTGLPLSPMLAGLQSQQYYAEIELSRPSRRRGYGIGGRAGVSVFEFEIESSGNYIFFIKYADDVSGPDLVFAIGKLETLGATPVGLGTLFGTFSISGLIIIRTYLKREKRKNRN